MQELWFLRFARRLMLVDIHIVSCSFQVIEWARFFMTDKVPRKIIQKV